MKTLRALIAALALAPGVTTTPPWQEPVQPPQAKREPTPALPDLSQGPQMREEKRKLVEARLEQGLRAAAELLGGGYVEEAPFDYELTAEDLLILAELSDAVVRGLVTNNMSELVRQEEIGFLKPIETIVTNYTIAVFDVYKGDAGLHSTDITVRIPGGRVEFDGGLWAETYVAAMAPPLNQEEFILFLRKHETVPEAYSVTYGRQGLFRVTPDALVIPSAVSWSPLWRTTRRDLSAFLQQVSDAVRRF